MYSIPVDLPLRGTSFRPRALRAEYDKVDCHIYLYKKRISSRNRAWDTRVAVKHSKEKMISVNMQLIHFPKRD